MKKSSLNVAVAVLLVGVFPAPNSSIALSFFGVALLVILFRVFGKVED